MFPDVINLKPVAMVVLAGTNDVARNTGPTTLKMIEDNIQAMTELARAHGIKVVLCSVLPIADYGRTPQSPQRPPADIVRLNEWMKAYAATAGAVYADYFSATVDAKGFLKEGISTDGLHPNAAGYSLMVPIVEAALQQAMTK
jgi:lysophospholipase L1-like esterase